MIFEFQPQYGKVLLPIFLVILIFSLIFACGGFLVWVIVRRKKTKNFDEKLKPPTSPVSLILSDAPRRWASVDQSPLRLCSLDDQTQSLQATSCLPSVNTTNSTFFVEPIDKDTLYGASVHSSFQPCTRFSAMDGSTYLGTAVDIPCKNEVTYCSTLPRHFPVVSRRRTLNGGLLTPMYSPSLLYSNCFQMSDPIGNDNNNNDDSRMMDSRLRSHTILGPPFAVENAQSYCVNSIPLNNSFTHSQVSSMHCGIPNCLGAIPSLASPYTYNIATTDADYRTNTGSCHVFNTTGFGVETTAEENHSSGNPSVLPPPPPTQFADVYMRSAC
ncbi:hypothetical protein AHF37_09472 [Paragonimus kellicotti]|nr:hypothetical protein AHF37_09472 [Paragonimus kellicotti]